MISQTLKISVEGIATIVADSSAKFINDNKLSEGLFRWQDSASAFSVSKFYVDNCVSIFLINPNTIRKRHLKKSMMS